MTEARKTREDAVVADNRKAGYDFHLLEQFEAGLVLTGTEVKAAREGRVNLRDAFCRLEGAEAYLLNAHIGQYSHGGYASHDPTRRRKLLLNKAELNKLLGKTTERGLTIVPLRMYFNKKGRIKLAIALAKGKKQYDKRETIRRREADRETRAAVKSRRV
ncbi:MAG TPA: SsrA-binding protein SmpB [Vicinamibacterales bacterium]|nr:SsrA-binding protein SmpB [Vicinamibacterales bacterium]